MNELKVLKSLVEEELLKIRNLLDEASDIEKKKESNINIRAGGSVLHDFYTGAENIFHAIASTLDNTVPSGLSWHVELLDQMTLNIKGVRSPVISKSTAKMLEEYLRFRHLFRKRYGFDLEWSNIRRLLKRLPVVYKSLKSDLDKVFSSSA